MAAAAAEARPIGARRAAPRPMGARYSNGPRLYQRNVGAAQAQVEGPGPEALRGHRALPGLPAAPAAAGIAVPGRRPRARGDSGILWPPGPLVMGRPSHLRGCGL